MTKNENQAEGAPPTAYPTRIPPQDQSGGPGLDSKTTPGAHWTQLEYWTNDGKPYLKEYEGRSVAILMAREGADVTIMYLPEEQEDADYTIEAIQKAGRKGHGIKGDLKEEAFCKSAIEEHLKVHGGRLNVLVNNCEFAALIASRDVADQSSQHPCKKSATIIKTSTWR